MEEDELKAYLKENLSISTKKIDGNYGSSDYIKISLRLDGEEISSDTFDLPERSSG